jgi:hypothetical protein
MAELRQKQEIYFQDQHLQEFLRKHFFQYLNQFIKVIPTLKAKKLIQIQKVTHKIKNKIIKL